MYIYIYIYSYINEKLGYEVNCSNGEFTSVFHTMDKALEWSIELPAMIEKEQWVDKENNAIKAPVMSIGMLVCIFM